MNKKLNSTAIVINSILLINTLGIILILSLAFHNAISYLIYDMPVNVVLTKFSSYSAAVYLLFSAIMIIVLVKQYNYFNLWLKRKHRSSSRKFNNVFFHNNFIKDHDIKFDSMKMLTFPWGILCIFSPLFLQIPMYVLLQNWKKISILENDFLQKIVESSGMKNEKLKTITFSTRNVWFWAIAFNVSMGALATIWIFFYLRKIQHFIKEVENNLNIVENFKNNR